MDKNKLFFISCYLYRWTHCVETNRWCVFWIGMTKITNCGWRNNVTLAPVNRKKQFYGVRGEEGSKHIDLWLQMCIYDVTIDGVVLVLKLKKITKSGCWITWRWRPRFENDFYRVLKKMHKLTFCSYKPRLYNNCWLGFWVEFPIRWCQPHEPSSELFHGTTKNKTLFVIYYCTKCFFCFVSNLLCL